MKKAIATLLFVILFFTSCKKEDANPPDNSKDPKQGSSWTYRQTILTENGTIAGAGNFTLVAKDTSMAGTAWLVLKETTSSTPFFIIQKRGTEWWWISLPNPTPSLWYKTNASLNEQYPLSVESGGTDTAKVAGLSVSTTVPAGTFNCQQVESFYANTLQDEWYFNADNGLLIKQSTYDSHTTGPGVWEKFRTELSSFVQ